MAHQIGVLDGVAPVPDQELAQSSLDTIGAMAGMLRKWKLIGEPVEISEDSPPMDRFLALIGRRPA